MRGGESLGKRVRRSVSSASDSSHGRTDRNTRRRLSSFSPAERGRRRTRSRSSRMDISHDDGSQRRGAGQYRSRSRKRGPNRSHSRSRETCGKRPARRFSTSRSTSRSPNRMDTSEDHRVPQNGHALASSGRRKRWGTSPGQRRPTYSRSRSRSPYHRRSPSPYSRRRQRSPSPTKNRNDDFGRSGPHGNRRRQFDDHLPPPTARDGPPPSQRAPPRERSLSPYSKRVAMTKAMQPGR